MVFYEDSELIQLANGNCFGEMALLNNDRRAATITAIQDTSFAVL
jgi:CRP-like cAMP-binding protein